MKSYKCQFCFNSICFIIFSSFGAAIVSGFRRGGDDGGGFK